MRIKKIEKFELYGNEYTMKELELVIENILGTHIDNAFASNPYTIKTTKAKLCIFDYLIKNRIAIRRVLNLFDEIENIRNGIVEQQNELE